MVSAKDVRHHDRLPEPPIALREIESAEMDRAGLRLLQRAPVDPERGAVLQRAAADGGPAGSGCPAPLPGVAGDPPVPAARRPVPTSHRVRPLPTRRQRAPIEMADTLTITDNRTGKTVRDSDPDGTIRAMDLRQIKAGRTTSA